MPSSIEEILKAKTVLALSDRSSLLEIKSQYKHLIKQWHPDKHLENQSEAQAMSVLINNAYEVIMDFLKEYPLDFSEETITKQAQSPAQWWEDRFGFR